MAKAAKHAIGLVALCVLVRAEEKPVLVITDDVQPKAGSGLRGTTSRCSPYTSCGSCMTATNCRWCPSQTGQQCHDFSSIVDPCPVPINSLGQCFSSTCPYALGVFFKDRPDDLVQWAAQTISAASDPLHAFPTYPAGSTGLFDLITGAPLTGAGQGSAASGFVIAAASDWGSGTCEAKVVSSLMAATSPGLTIHLGDVYYVGRPEQVRTNVLGQAASANQVGVAFPKGRVGTFLMNANHEMISGGNGLMEDGFGYTGQQATYASHQSDSWRFITLDSGYLCYETDQYGHRLIDVKKANLKETDAPLPQAVVDWLVNEAKVNDPSDTRGLVLFTHHQPYSDFDSSYLGVAKQLSQILPPGKQVIWFFGHEHRLALYNHVQLAEASNFSFFPRMVGNGGFPVTPKGPQRTGNLIAYDKRTYQTMPQDLGGEENVGFNGFFTISVTGQQLQVDYITGKCAESGCNSGYDESSGTTVASEVFNVDLSTGRLSHQMTHIGNELTQVGLVKEVLELSAVSRVLATPIAAAGGDFTGGLYALKNTCHD